MQIVIAILICEVSTDLGIVRPLGMYSHYSPPGITKMRRI